MIAEATTTHARPPRRTRVVVLVLLAQALAACGGGGDASQTSQRQAGGATSAGGTATATGAVTLAGVTFTPPPTWRDLGASGMRQAQYQLAPVAGDPAPAEVNVFYFGPQSGGGVEANLQRWIGQMVLPGGGDPVDAAERSVFAADGMTGHVVALNGGYQPGAMRPMGGGDEAKPGYRLVGVVLEGPQGSLFFKLTGPENTARAMERDLLQMVRGARR